MLAAIFAAWQEVERVSQSSSQMKKSIMVRSGIPRTAVLLVSLLAGSGAMGQKVNVQFDPSAAFSDYRTFAILNGTLNSRNPALNSELVKKQIETDIRRDLTARGLTEVQTQPDLHVVYHFGAARKTELESFPAGWRGWGTRYERVPYAEGTLVIDLRYTGKHSLVWRGIASEEKSDPAKLAGKLDDMVKKTIEKYPPKEK
jgi:hypothetical protein